MSQITFTVTFEIETCCQCGIQFAMTRDYQAERRRKNDNFHCPAGHAQHYRAESREAEVARVAKAEQERLQAQVNAEKHARLVAEKGLREAAEEAARLKNRMAHGVCTCCNRTFSDLAQHMKSKHPAEIPGHVQRVITDGALVRNMGIGVRAMNRLILHKVETVDQLCAFTEVELMGWKNMGEISVREIKQVLRESGRSLRAHQ